MSACWWVLESALFVGHESLSPGGCVEAGNWASCEWIRTLTITLASGLVDLFCLTVVYIKGPRVLRMFSAIGSTHPHLRTGTESWGQLPAELVPCQRPQRRHGSTVGRTAASLRSGGSGGSVDHSPPTGRSVVRGSDRSLVRSQTRRTGQMGWCSGTGGTGSMARFCMFYDLMVKNELVPKQQSGQARFLPPKRPHPLGLTFAASDSVHSVHYADAKERIFRVPEGRARRDRSILQCAMTFHVSLLKWGNPPFHGVPPHVQTHPSPRVRANSVPGPLWDSHFAWEGHGCTEAPSSATNEIRRAL